MGRITVHTPEIAIEICRRMSSGESLRAICQDEGFPPESTVRMWVAQDREGFAAQYAQARDAQGHAIAERGYQDAITATDAQTGRLKFDAARWFAGKVLPKVYGDKLDLNHSGEVKTIPDEQLESRLALLLGKTGTSGAS